MVTFSQFFSSAPSPHTDPLVKVEPQRPVKEEEPKTAEDMDQEAVRAWGLEEGWPDKSCQRKRKRILNPPSESDF